jgi:FkbM family methyltransferase
VLNDRPAWLIARNVIRPSNYLALARIPRVYERPLPAAAGYFLGSGTYPCSVRVRTPAGPISVMLFNSHDAVTVHEIFCRQDYRCPAPPRLVVDLGSNIGISALYFLTRSQTAYCELYEPDPRNVSRLLINLEQFDGRFELHEHAVADRQGVLPFVREPTGRYGSLDASVSGPAGDPTVSPPASPTVPGHDVINVDVEHINTVLDRAITRHGEIDLLKVDTEGSELATVMAIEANMRKHIRRIVIESFERGINLDGFDASWSCDTITFKNKSYDDARD